MRGQPTGLASVFLSPPDHDQTHVAGPFGPLSTAAVSASRMDTRLLLVYRHILKAAKLFPSIKRNAVIAEIKVEFREGKVCCDDDTLSRSEAEAASQCF